MKSSLFWILGLLTALSNVAHAQPTAAAALELNLAIGENQTIPATDVKSYSEGAAGVADIKLTPNGSHFVVVGQKPGSTTLLFIKRDGAEVTWNINVFARPLKTVANELTELLGDQTGIAVKKIGARFFIEGGVSSEADLQRIQHIAALYDGQVVSLVVLGGAAAVRKINIRVDFYFVQYDKTRSRQLGIDWPGRVAARAANFAFDFLANAVTAASAAVSAQPLPGVDLAASNGWAKVLKHATVITSNGAEANFSSGGVQNFQLIGGLANSIQSIKFGTDVRVLPRFDPVSREISVNIDADVADLTAPGSGTNLPGQNLSKLNTHVALKLGQSVVLSGIRTSDEQHSTRGLPWLSEIPVLGLLFGSQGVKMHDVEGALFIVPSVLDTASAYAVDLIDHALEEYDDFSGDIKHVSSFDERPYSQRVRPRGGL
ncbi:MAG: pilus assembly protein N-terminal domain-containing protein [Polyangiales bacterium]